MTEQSIDQPPRYLVPALGGIYAVLSPYSWPLVRVATGLFFVRTACRSCSASGAET